MGVPHISNRSGRQPERWSRRGILAALGAVPTAAVLTGCSGSADASQATSTASARAAAKKAAIRVTPADGTRKADFAAPVEVTVTDGTLASVKVTGTTAPG